MTPVCTGSFTAAQCAVSTIFTLEHAHSHTPTLTDARNNGKEKRIMQADRQTDRETGKHLKVNLCVNHQCL